MQQKKEYTSTSHNYLKAEAFCAEMMYNGLLFNEIRLVCDSNFKKGYHNEIESVRFYLNEETNTEEMELVVNRDGIYDRLPEGLFHQSKGDSRTSSITEKTEEYRRFKDEERMARKFFQPIETELFRYSTLVEQEELNLSFGMLNGDLKNELSDFWDIPAGLPSAQVKKLVQIMPWVKMIKGEIEQTAKALELILSKPVKYQQQESYNQQMTDQLPYPAFLELGIDTVLGSSFWEPSITWKFTIEDITRKEIEGYRPNGPFGKLLKHFEEILIPLQIDIIFDYAVITSEDFETQDFLGFSLTL